jgi:hypothetical protein
MSDTNVLLSAANFIAYDLIPVLLSPRVIGSACLIPSLCIRFVTTGDPTIRMQPGLKDLIPTLNNVALASSAIAICTGSTFAAATSLALSEVNCMLLVINSSLDRQGTAIARQH